MSNGTNATQGSPTERDTKWMIGTIVAAVIATGIGVGVVVSLLAGNETAHVWKALRDHERRVNDSNNAVIMEVRTLLHTLRDDDRDRRGDLEQALNRVRRSLDDLMDSPYGTACRAIMLLHGIERELTEMRRCLSDTDDSAESSAGALENIERQLAEILRRLPEPEAPTESPPAGTPENADESSTDQTPSDALEGAEAEPNP